MAPTAKQITSFDDENLRLGFSFRWVWDFDFDAAFLLSLIARTSKAARVNATANANV
jgi:hypothetical protein